MAGLNAKQSRFVEEYLIDLNATQSAIRAGYSPKTAGQQAFDLLKKPEIEEAIAEAKQRRSKRTEITQDMVLREYAKIGFADIRKAVAWGSEPLPTENPDDDRIYPVELIASEQMDDDTAAAVSEVSLTAQGVKIKMYDKKGALDSIGKHLGMFTDVVDHKSSDGTMTPKDGGSASERFFSKLARIAPRAGETSDTGGTK